MWWRRRPLDDRPVDTVTNPPQDLPEQTAGQMAPARPRTIVQVGPPVEGGVLDYLACLESAWRERGIAVDRLLVDQAGCAATPLTHQLSACVGDAPCTLVLHYSGYGYGHRGLCGWLMDELAALCRQRGNAVRLVVVFHELYAFGPPWRSAFWLAPQQARLAARLARLADAVWTNSLAHAQWLRRHLASGRPLVTRPVFSNIGDCATPPPLGERLPRAVVFGSASTRQRAFAALEGSSDLLAPLGPLDWVEVGSGPACAPAALNCRHVGRLKAHEVAALLLESRLAVLDYTAELLGKSGVLAAYAAHGCLVIDTCVNGRDADGLCAGRDYLRLSDLSASASDPGALQARADALHRWYADHTLVRQAGDLLALTQG
jgi:hypothetical protein